MTTSRAFPISVRQRIGRTTKPTLMTSHWDQKQECSLVRVLPFKLRRQIPWSTPCWRWKSFLVAPKSTCWNPAKSARWETWPWTYLCQLLWNLRHNSAQLTVERGKVPIDHHLSYRHPQTATLAIQCAFVKLVWPHFAHHCAVELRPALVNQDANLNFQGHGNHEWSAR